jgi:hypothetical protein
VRGIRITDYCDQNNLSTEQRLDLFIQVCHAIQHARQKGIIHRDIKPSNILVTINDGVPVPKVIDFGIAKATEQRLTDKTLFTAFEQFIGTPAYMSPEQAEMTSLDIDTRSDIYALGVLLYELLTGQTPFNAKELIAAGLEGMRRIIREQEPMRPSTCISTLNGADQTTVAKRRQSDPPKLIHQVRRDLDWIVMKCLEKDRTRRYETANGLAADIERHLEHRPVLAAAPSALYRARKFVRRHRTAMMVATALLGLLVAGVVFSTWQAVRATRAEHEQSRERQRAEQNEEQARQARAREAELRQQAQAQEWLARQRAYASDMKAAQAALEQENRGLVDVLLRRYLPKPGEENLRGIEWRYLWHLSRDDEVCSFRHSGMVQAAVFSPDGQYLATANSEGRIALWEVVSGRRLREFLTSPFGLTGKSLSFSPDGGWLALPGPPGGRD